MRTIRFSAAIALAAFALVGLDHAHAQAPEQPAAQTTVSLDAAKIAQYEAWLRADLYHRRSMCEYVRQIVRAGFIRRPGTYQRRMAEYAQACWNALPGLETAFALARLFEIGGDTGAADAAIATMLAHSYYRGDEPYFRDDPQVLAGQAGRRARAGDLAEANRLLDQALARGPRHDGGDPDAWIPFADVLLDGEAVRPLRVRVFDAAWRRAETRRNKAEQARILELRAMALMQAQRHQEALADLDRAYALAPESVRPRVQWQRARARKALGDLEGARADFAAAREIWPPLAAWESNERRREAAEAAPPACWIAMRAMSNATFDTSGDTDATIAAGDECIAAGHRAIGLTLKGAMRSTLGDRTGALAMLDEAIAADPAYVPAHIWRASALNGAERYAEARAAADRAVELDRLNPRALGVRADALIQLGDRQAARTDYERALGLHPADEFAARHVRNLVALGDHRCALDALDAARRYSFASADMIQQRPSIVSEVNKLPRADRACATPVKLGAAFEF